MNILFCYNNEKVKPLIEWLKSNGHNVIPCNNKIKTLQDYKCKIDLLISFSYRYYISKEVINEVRNNAINIHISYLPWNRGADPNLWSWIENTPKGVSIHYVSSEIDCGDLIAQKITKMEKVETLVTSYNKLIEDAIDLFKSIFTQYSNWERIRKPQIGKGSTHFSYQLYEFKKKLNYNMTVEKVKEEFEKIKGEKNEYSI